MTLLFTTEIAIDDVKEMLEKERLVVSEGVLDKLRTHEGIQYCLQETLRESLQTAIWDMGREESDD